jgi:hypothetical protein
MAKIAYKKSLMDTNITILALQKKFKKKWIMLMYRYIKLIFVKKKY